MATVEPGPDPHRGPDLLGGASRPRLRGSALRHPRIPLHARRRAHGARLHAALARHPRQASPERRDGDFHVRQRRGLHGPPGAPCRRRRPFAARLAAPGGRAPRILRHRRGRGHVIRTGEPELVSEISDSLLRAVAGGADHLALLRGLGFVSYMAVPLSARGRTLGAITFASAESGRRFGRADLALAEELAHGAALAVDKARHYEAEGRARAAAEAASRAKDAFLATVSHELRTPLSPILAWSRMLRQGTLGEEKTRRALEVIERCARSQAQLVEDLLDVSRIISGKLRLEVRPVLLAPVVQAAVEVVRPAADAKGLELQAVLDS